MACECGAGKFRPLFDKGELFAGVDCVAAYESLPVHVRFAALGAIFEGDLVRSPLGEGEGADVIVLFDQLCRFGINGDRGCDGLEAGKTHSVF
jgi:hypothetical protein